MSPISGSPGAHAAAATPPTHHGQPYKLHRLDSGPKESASCTRDEALKMYTQMQTIRRLEGAAGNLYKEKVVRGFCHLYSGQEACAVGESSQVVVVVRRVSDCSRQRVQEEPTEGALSWIGLLPAPSVGSTIYFLESSAEFIRACLAH